MLKILTQTQISAYERCRYFYYLRNVRKLVWPIEAGESNSIRQGDNFHLLVRQLILGFPAESLIVSDKDENVRRWLDVYCSAQPLGSPEQVFAEKEVSILFADVLWLGKFDALTVNDDRLTIYDWKTGSARPEQEKYQKAPQTRLYRFLARSCASRLIGAGLHAIPAENIEMVYWFPEYPDREIRLPYSEEEYQRDMTWIKTRAREMSSVDESDYPRTQNTRYCRFCAYRTFCFTAPDVSFQEEEIPQEESPELSEDIWQAGLFFPESFSEDEPEAVNF